jgi:hypothetical protein
MPFLPKNGRMDRVGAAGELIFKRRDHGGGLWINLGDADVVRGAFATSINI